MDILLMVAWLLIGTGAYCAIWARRLDNELRRSLPPTIELRPRERALPGIPGDRRADPLADLEWELQAREQGLLDQVLPLRWRLRSPSPVQTALVQRIGRLMIAAFVLVVLGLTLVAVAGEWMR